jgi:excisionase family DNA binding protein
MAEPLLLRVDEVARALALGRSKVYELIASGELPSLTIGTARRVPADVLRRWIEEHLEGSAGEAP